MMKRTLLLACGILGFALVAFGSPVAGAGNHSRGSMRQAMKGAEYYRNAGYIHYHSGIACDADDPKSHRSICHVHTSFRCIQIDPAFALCMHSVVSEKRYRLAIDKWVGQVTQAAGPYLEKKKITSLDGIRKLDADVPHPHDGPKCNVSTGYHNGWCPADRGRTSCYANPPTAASPPAMASCNHTYALLPGRLRRWNAADKAYVKAVNDATSKFLNTIHTRP
jgi:hypothetical protein